MNKNEIDSLYGKRFFKRRVRKYHDKEIETAKIIYQIFKPKSVLDVGCALGSYLLEYKRLGCKVSGNDKYLDRAKKFCDPEILPNLYVADAGLLWEYKEKYELVQCIEVAEHLPHSDSLNLISNICNMSSKHIFFTAAQPGQRGKGHINCMEKEYWLELFKTFGFVQDIEKEIESKDKLKDFGVVKNLIVLKKD
jgi:2-polyprenyl-3-methyl-5-hydroxy-6-metoxy-1,4-benzoquinol methylase